jgi:hypothetical protein
MNIIITMAGNSRRFREAGFTQPKYEIEAHERTLFEWSMLSLSQFWQTGARAVFVTRREFNAAPFIQAHAPLCGITECSVVELDQATAGQAETAMKAQAALRELQAPLMIYNIDTLVLPSALSPLDVQGDGWIPCFPGEGDGWSFAKADGVGHVSEVREKVRISDWATIGLYHFASFDLFKALYEQHFANGGGRERGELYIAPMYNTLIANQGDVRLGKVPLDAVIPLGTPAELGVFVNNPRPSLHMPC